MDAYLEGNEGDQIEGSFRDCRKRRIWQSVSSTSPFFL